MEADCSSYCHFASLEFGEVQPTAHQCQSGTIREWVVLESRTLPPVCKRSVRPFGESVCKSVAVRLLLIVRQKRQIIFVANSCAISVT